MNTLYPDYTGKMLKFANEQRVKNSSMDFQDTTVKVSEEWWKMLNEIPFLSSKYLFNI
jgi:uncharacterized membrane protein